jgi:hypothetical protein
MVEQKKDRPLNNNISTFSQNRNIMNNSFYGIVKPKINYTYTN